MTAAPPSTPRHAYLKHAHWLAWGIGCIGCIGWLACVTGCEPKRDVSTVAPAEVTSGDAPSRTLMDSPVTPPAPAESTTASTPPLAKHEDPPATDATAPGTALDVATSCMNALRAGDLALLSQLSAYPFEFRDTGTEVACEGSTSRDAAQLQDQLRCLVQDDLLREELRDHPQLAFDQVSAKSMPKWGRRWRRELPPGSTTMAVEIRGNGINFHFVVVVVDRKLRALWKDAEFWE